jgi:hypothetical protein
MANELLLNGKESIETNRINTTRCKNGTESYPMTHNGKESVQHGVRMAHNHTQPAQTNGKVQHN